MELGKPYQHGVGRVPSWNWVSYYWRLSDFRDANTNSFTQGKPTATSTEEASEEMIGFWKNFMETFELTGKEVYVAGESYAGKYVPVSLIALVSLIDVVMVVADGYCSTLSTPCWTKTTRNSTT